MNSTTYVFKRGYYFHSAFLHHLSFIMGVFVLWFLGSAILHLLFDDIFVLSRRLILGEVLSGFSFAILFDVLISCGKLSLDSGKQQLRYFPAWSFPAFVIDVRSIESVSRSHSFFGNLVFHANNRQYKVSVDEPDKLLKLLCEMNPKIIVD